MPYKKELAKKKKLSPAVLAYLSDSDGPIGEFDEGSLWCLRNGMPGFFDDDANPKDLWEKHRGDFLPEFIEKNPGRRPLPWWAWDAPRWDDPFEGVYFHGTLCEPRLRIGGKGETPWDAGLAVVPHFAKGIPTGWVLKSQEDYYNGRQVDIHGQKIGTCNEGDFKGKAIDPDDPPRFASEAAYLERHGLLTDAEKKFVEKNPSLLEPEKVE